MEIEVKRYILDKEYTIGHLYINNVHICDTLEDRDRDLNSKQSSEEIKKIKVYGRTAIPIGRYEVVLDYSSKFKKILPHILNVKGFSGVRFHSLNNASESLGCVGVGEYKGGDMIVNSRMNMTYFQNILLKVLEKNEDINVTFSYEDAFIDRRS